MEYSNTTRIKKRQHNPYPNRRTSKADGTSSVRDLVRWIFIIPIVWLLVFGSSSLSAIGAAHPDHIDLLSNLQANYNPWTYMSIHPIREGFFEDILHDHNVLDQAISVFSNPIQDTNPFFEQNVVTIEPTVETPTHTPVPSQTEPIIVIEGTATDPIISLTPSSTGDINASPTASLTPSRTSSLSSTSTPTSSYTPTPSRTASPTPSRTASPTPSRTTTPTPSRTATSTPSVTLTPSPTPSPSRTPSPIPTQSITICNPPWNPSYDYLHPHTPYVNNNIFGYIVHAFPVTGPETEVILTDMTIYQDAGNPNILEVTNINWYHTGMNIIYILVNQRAEVIHVPVNRSFYACYAAGQCDHSLYGGFIEAEFDDTLVGSYDIEITVDFPEYNQTCTVIMGITN